MTLPDFGIRASGHQEAGGMGNPASPPKHAQSVESCPASFNSLLHKARQIRRVRTNPASYCNGTLDYPLCGEFWD